MSRLRLSALLQHPQVVLFAVVKKSANLRVLQLHFSFVINKVLAKSLECVEIFIFEDYVNLVSDILLALLRVQVII